MKILYSNQSIPKELPEKSVFLAGPTPRLITTPSWRPEALDILKKLKYKGLVFLPEFKVPKPKADYDTQVNWENTGLHCAEFIVFWIPRELKTMPAFTTNVEFGRFAHNPKTLYGRPDNAPKNRYLDWYYRQVNWRPIYNNLEEMLKRIV